MLNTNFLIAAFRPEWTTAVFDSTIGAQPILREIMARKIRGDWIYVADNLKFPWGAQTEEEAVARMRYWFTIFTARGITQVILGCNSASVAYIRGRLAAEFPQLRVVTILEAGTRLVVRQQWDAVAVLSTNLTANSDIYRLLIRQMARRKVRVIQEGVPRLINLIASGDFDGEATRREIASCCSRFAEAGIQALVPGCTHLTHSAHVFREYFRGAYVDPVGECVDMVEAKFGEDQQSSFSSPAAVRYFTSGDPDSFASIASKVTGMAIHAERFPALPKGA